MTDCRLTIASRGDGWESNIICRAGMEISQGCARIEYELEGDRCVFTLRPERAEQVRRGGVNIRLSFVEGGKTSCIIGDEALRGGYEIYTVRLSCRIGARGAAADIQYLSGGDGERITLRLRAYAVE